MRMIGELGHEPHVADAGETAEDLEGVGLLIVEPADPKSALLAKTVRTLAAELPVLCVSVLDSSELDIEFDVFLAKPFTFEQLAGAIEQALALSASGRASL